MRKLLLILCLASSVFGANVSWRGTLSQDWNTGSNWDSCSVPASADMAIISSSPGAIINSATNSINSIKVNGPLTVNSGNLTTSGSWIIIGYESGTNGTLTIENGTVTAGTTMYVGFDGSGTLNMNGGTLNVVGTRFGIARNNAAAVGHLYLRGGIITCLDFTMATIAGSSATMDITGGRLIINGDKTGIIGTYKNNGWITGFGQSNNVRYDYNVTTSGKTTVWAYNNSTLPGKASIPNPINGAANTATNISLAWLSGANATSHDVYFGTSNPPTTLIGNQTSASYTPGSLSSNTTYYWQINEKNEVGTTTGDIWSFTTMPPSGPIAKNIHLQWNENASDSTMTAIWATLSDTNSIVKYGLTNSYGMQKTGTSIYVPACGQYIHTVELTGLSANTTYHYSCGSNASWSEDATFRSGLRTGDTNDFTFALGGDTRNPDDIVPNPTYAGYRIAVMNTVLFYQPRFFMFMGDYTDRGRFQDQWDEVFENLKPQTTTMPYMMVWGSHEDPDSYPNAFAQFEFPTNGTTADKDKYYSFDYGNTHIIVLYATAAAASNPLTDSLIPAGSTQYNWLLNDLQQAENNPNIEWKLVFVHAPPYSTATRSGGGSCVGLRADLGQLMGQFGVNAVFTAHEHNFERTHLIKDDSLAEAVPNGSTLVNPQGTIYYVSGGAGAGLNDCDGNAWFSATHQNTRHFLLVKSSGKSLNIKAIQVDGTILDEITIVHSGHIDGDFNNDGTVDLLDLKLINNYWLTDGLWP